MNQNRLQEMTELNSQFEEILDCSFSIDDGIVLGGLEMDNGLTLSVNNNMAINPPVIDDTILNELPPKEVVIIEKEVSSGGSSGEPCTCDLTYSNPKVEQNVGNVKIGEKFDKETIQQVLDRIFAASYAKPTISIGLSCKNLYDKDTDSLTSVTITANVTKKSEKISYVKFYVGGSLVETITTSVADGGVFKYTYTPTAAIKATTAFKVETCDETTKSVVSSSAYVTFVQKSYWGSISSVLSPTDLDVITLLTNGLKTSVSMSQTFTAEYGRFVFAYPKAIGSVKSIKDNVNNFNYTDSCSRANLTINGGAYEVIYLTDCAGFDGVTITFA